MGIVGTLGLSPTTIDNQTGPRVSKGKGPGPGCPTNVGPTLRPDISRGLSPYISRPMDARLTFRPGAWGLHGPEGLTLTFPSGNSPKLSWPPDFYLTSESSFMNRLRRSRRNREVLSNGVPIWKAVTYKGNKSPFPKKDPTSPTFKGRNRPPYGKVGSPISLHKRETNQTKKGTHSESKEQSLLTQDLPEKG